MAEWILEDPMWDEKWPYSEADFRRKDESSDKIYHYIPRLRYHIDGDAVSALTNYYAKNFKDGEDVLDICSSWVSHFPKEWKGGNVVGLGMNEYELRKNVQLSSYDEKDLNEDPTFPYEDASFDKVTCVVSIEYLNKPRAIFAEIGRVLRPDGECIISMTNHSYADKSIQIWLKSSDLEHIYLVGSYFHYSGLFEPPKCDDISPNPGRTDPMYIVRAKRKI
jgi:SAM-dependent methyltransferase